MLKKTLRAALACGAAAATAIGFTATATATTGTAMESPASVAEVSPDAIGGLDGLGGLTELEDVNVGNDLCLLPWFWPGPFNVGTSDMTGHYAACNGSSSGSGEGVNILNNVCVAPWLWQGPFNFLTQGQDSHYEACNQVSETTSFANALMQYMTIDYMIDEGMLDASQFEAFLLDEVSADEVILDEAVSEDFQVEVPGADADAAPEAEGGVGNNMCVLPWLWQGPLNFLTQGQSAHYEACNG